MDLQLVNSIAWSVVNCAAIVLLAPLVEGVARKVSARLQSRIGPPVTQGYRDLLKLLSRRVEIDPEGSGAPFRMFPHFYLAVVLCIGLLLPSVVASTLPISDVILIIYMLTLVEFLRVMASYDTSNPYPVIGSSRRVVVTLVAEASLLAAVFSQVIKPYVASTSMIGIVKGVAGNYSMVLSTPSYYVALMASLLALVSEIEVVPYDVGEAEQEILGGLSLEYSGRILGFYHLADLIRKTVLATLVLDVFIPWPIALSTASPLPIITSAALYVVKIVLLFTVIAVVSQTMARFRVFDATKSMFAALMLSMVSIILSSMGV